MTRRIRPGLFAAMLVLLSAMAAVARVPVVQPILVKTYPHDRQAFTEGLLFQDGILYESTGLEGQSAIRAVDLNTGRVIRSIRIAPGLFGEGIVAWKDQLLSVTWRDRIGFRWRRSDLRQIGTFHYDGEGWAMTEDGKYIILSDGTAILRFLDPDTLRLVRRLSVTADGQPVENLNELEYVKGDILANVWLTTRIARIDAKTGRVKEWIDVSGLARKAHVTNPDSVANGIAYDKVRDRLFLTGKNWPAVFEVRIRGLSTGTSH